MKERREGETERNMMIKEEAAEDINDGERGLPRRTIAASQRSDEEGRETRARERAAEIEEREREAKQGVTQKGTRRDEEKD